MINLLGIHHVTAITSSAEKIYEFFTYTLGMRLVKKTVNQDDIQTYHLFFADDKGSAGTDMTFFDFKNIQKATHYNNEVSRTSFRVKSDKALEYWLKRFKRLNVKHTQIEEHFGKKFIYFSDFDDQQYAIVSDEGHTGTPLGDAWNNGPVPNEFQLLGLGPIFFRVSRLDYMDEILKNVLGFEFKSKEGSLSLYEVNNASNGGSVILEFNQILPDSRQGFGGVHHVAFRVKDTSELMKSIDVLNDMGYRNSGYVDRHYFESLYVRLYPSILFEFATDGPGFIDGDETYENLGDTLALPPLYKDKRAYVEKVVRQFDTKRSDKVFEKELE